MFLFADRDGDFSQPDGFVKAECAEGDSCEECLGSALQSECGSYTDRAGTSRHSLLSPALVCKAVGRKYFVLCKLWAETNLDSFRYAIKKRSITYQDSRSKVRARLCRDHKTLAEYSCGEGLSMALKPLQTLKLVF